eukprot:6180093-Pleurochrysis_carterae.AAC.1
MRPRVENRSTEGQQRVVVDGISTGFPPQKALSGSPGTQRQERKRRSTTASADERAREVLWRLRISVGLADF